MGGTSTQFGGIHRLSEHLRELLDDLPRWIIRVDGQVVAHLDDFRTNLGSGGEGAMQRFGVVGRE
jgi:hypothetical protein